VSRVYDERVFGGRVLLIEDDPHLLHVIVKQFKEQGFDVAPVTDVDGALDLLETWPPQAIVVDLDMSSFDARAFARDYRDRPVPHAPIFAIAERAPDELLHAIQVAGVVQAPFAVDDLVALVGDFLVPGFQLRDIPTDEH
jgi:CheY-like chemotaxis protein